MEQTHLWCHDDHFQFDPFNMSPIVWFFSAFSFPPFLRLFLSFFLTMHSSSHQLPTFGMNKNDYDRQNSRRKKKKKLSQKKCTIFDNLQHRQAIFTLEQCQNLCNNNHTITNVHGYDFSLFFLSVIFFFHVNNPLKLNAHSFCVWSMVIESKYQPRNDVIILQ